MAFEVFNEPDLNAQNASYILSLVARAFKSVFPNVLIATNDMTAITYALLYWCSLVLLSHLASSLSLCPLGLSVCGSPPLCFSVFCLPILVCVPSIYFIIGIGTEPTAVLLQQPIPLDI